MEQIVYRNLIHHLHLLHLHLLHLLHLHLLLLQVVALERDTDAVLIVQYLNLTNKAQIVIKIYDYV
jgi:hypothetical protein